MTVLFAPPDYWMLTKDQRADISNGCGTRGLLGLLVPDTVYFLSIKSACDIHDFMYAIGINIKDKQEADRVFLNNMMRIIDHETRWDWLKVLRLRRAKTYYQAVKNFGGLAFWSGKNAPENKGGYA
jgi:hypothetical protein